MNDASSPNRRGLNAGLMQNAFGALLSVTVAPLVLAPVAAEFGWRVAFFLAGVPGLILVLLVLRFVREPAPPPRAAAEKRTFANPLGLLRIRNIALCGMIGACLAGWGLLIPPFLPLYFEQMRGMDPVTSQQMLGVLGFSTLIFGFLFPGLSDRVGRRPIMVAACLISILLPLGALLYDGPAIGFGVILFFGWIGTGVFPLFMGIIPAESTSRAVAATAMGLIVAVAEVIGGVLVPTLGGWLADMFDLRAVLWLSASLALVAAFLSLFLKETAPLKLARMAQAA
jgi:MFS family permease